MKSVIHGMSLRLAASVACVVILMTLAACGGDGDKRPVVTVSTALQQQLVSQLMPDELRLQSLLPDGQDLESVMPADSTIARTGDSKAFLTFESSRFEGEVLRRLGREYPDVSQLYVARSVPRILDTHYADTIRINNPHMILSLRNSRRMLLEAAMRLGERFPRYETEILNRANDYDDRLQQLDDSLSAILLPHYGAAFVSVHPRLGYFARDYGLREIALCDVGRATPDSLAEQRLLKASHAGPVVVFYTADKEKAEAERAASRLGIPMVRLPLDSADYIRALRMAAETIATAR